MIKYDLNLLLVLFLSALIIIIFVIFVLFYVYSIHPLIHFKKKITSNKSPTTETLGNIISAFAQELTKASVSADLMRVKMKNAYESNSLLKEYEPSKIRLITAKVSLPVAFIEHTLNNMIDQGLSKSQITSMISNDVPFPIRNKITDDVISELGKQNKFSNNKLDDIMKEIVRKIRIEDFNYEKHFDVNKIMDFRNEWSSNLMYEQEARFIYKAEDLEKLSPNNIAKFDITLDIS